MKHFVPIVVNDPDRPKSLLVARMPVEISELRYRQLELAATQTHSTYDATERVIRSFWTGDLLLRHAGDDDWKFNVVNIPKDGRAVEGQAIDTVSRKLYEYAGMSSESPEIKFIKRARPVPYEDWMGRSDVALRIRSTVAEVRCVDGDLFVPYVGPTFHATLSTERKEAFLQVAHFTRYDPHTSLNTFSHLDRDEVVALIADMGLEHRGDDRVRLTLNIPEALPRSFEGIAIEHFARSMIASATRRAHLSEASRDAHDEIVAAVAILRRGNPYSQAKLEDAIRSPHNRFVRDVPVDSELFELSTRIGRRLSTYVHEVDLALARKRIDAMSAGSTPQSAASELDGLHL